MTNITHPDNPVGTVGPAPDIDQPTGDAERISDKGDGLTSVPLSFAPPPDPRTHWRLVPANTLNRAQRLTQSEIRGEIAGYRSSIPLAYGRVRLPGKVTAIYHQSGNYYFVFGICKGPVTDINKAYWNGVEITITAGGTNSFDGDLPEAGDLNIYDGNQSYIDPELVRLTTIPNFPNGYTSTHQGYVYAMAKVPATLVDGLPRLEVDLDGFAIYDDRSGGSTAFSDNPALIAADILSNRIRNPQTMDWDSVSTAADYSEEQVGGENRWAVGMALQRPRPVPEWIGVMQSYGSFYSDGTGATVKFITDKPRDSVATFGPGKIVEGSTSWNKDMGTRHPDDVVVEWIDVTTGATKLAYAIGGLSSPLEEFIRMPGFTSHNQAKRFAVQRLNQIRLRDLTYTVDVSNDGMLLTVGDRIQLTDQRWRVINKPFVVVGITIPEEGIYRLSLIEYQPNAYSDEVETEPVIDDSSLPSPFDYPDAPSFTVTYGTTNEGATGDVRHWAEVTWTTPTDFPYITGWHILAGWGGKPTPSIDPEVLVDIIMPPETTTFRVYGADPLWGAGFNPNDYNFYLTILTATRPNRVLQFTDPNDNLGSGTGADASNGVYHQYLELQDDPTPGPVNNVQVTSATGGVLVTWRYGRRPNYIMQFHVDIVNVTDGDTQATILSDGLSIFVPDSVFSGDSGDTMRADVKVANRNITIYSSIVSSATFTAP